MLSAKKSQELIQYWKDSAKRDFQTMNDLYSLQRYPECLFFGHLTLEKLLKSYVVQSLHTHAPYTHDLVRLSQHANLDFSGDELKQLKEINYFNIQSRYPDHKLQFHKQCNKKFTANYIQIITHFYHQLWSLQKQKK